MIGVKYESRLLGTSTGPSAHPTERVSSRIPTEVRSSAVHVSQRLRNLRESS